MTRTLLLHLGGLGDLVLASGLVEGLKRAVPGGEVTLACRSDLASVVDLYPVRPDAVVPIALNPYLRSVPSPDLLEDLGPILDRLLACASDVVIDGSLRPTWFTWVAAAALAAAGRAAPTRIASATPEPGRHLAMLLHDLGLARPLVERIVPPPGTHERRRYGLLLESLGAIPRETFPWSLEPSTAERARAILCDAGLAERGYLACFPAGTAATRIKRWPLDRYESVLGHALEEWALPVLLVGERSEREALEALAQALGGAARPVRTFLGEPGEVPLLAGLLAMARLTLGNDTGPMHLAAAFGTPGVGLYGGGGEWPAYAPWGPGTIGLHQPLPCYGCGWDCFLDQALCVESLPVDAVIAALAEARENPRAEPSIRPLDRVEPHVAALASEASARYRAAQHDRAERFEVISELKWALAEREARIAAMEKPRASAVQISIGLGAGNIGDELMARAFWDRLPPDVLLEVPLFPEAARQHEPYPSRHRTRPVDWDGNENADVAGMPGLLVGATPVTEAEGLHFPMRFLARRLASFHERGLPVHAVGVGVDALSTEEGLALFARAFAPIRSWTVRSAPCRDALLALGVEPERVRVGADWAWLHAPRRDAGEWAGALWRSLGVDPSRPLLVANVVNMLWRKERDARLGIARGLDLAAERFGLQIAFFCNECRAGEFFDFEAAREIGGMMRSRPVLVPNEYYSADEAIALLHSATVAVGARYHFVVEAVLAGTVPVSILRGQKMRALLGELGSPVGGTVDRVDPDELSAAIREAVDERDAFLTRLVEARQRLARRAEGNLAFLGEWASG